MAIIKEFFISYFNSIKNLFGIPYKAGLYLKTIVISFLIALFFSLPFFLLAMNSIYFSFTLPIAQVFYFIGFNVFNILITIVFVDIIKGNVEDEEMVISKKNILIMHSVLSLLATLYFVFILSTVIGAL